MITDDVNKLVSKNRFNQTAIKLKPKQCNKHRIVNLLVPMPASQPVLFSSN
ncbi:hypothetical protein GCM10027170_00920 [Aliiglaciecola aliphaticivorans]